MIGRALVVMFGDIITVDFTVGDPVTATPIPAMCRS
jgi:hypothetical protein